VLWSISFLFFFWGGVRLSPLVKSASIWPIVPSTDNRRMWSGRWNENFKVKRSTRRKPVPVPLYPPQIPHEVTWDTGCRGGKSATNRLSYGTALLWSLLMQHMQFHALTHCCPFLVAVRKQVLRREFQTWTKNRRGGTLIDWFSYCRHIP
jgi:hypothetical protein